MENKKTEDEYHEVKWEGLDEKFIEKLKIEMHDYMMGEAKKGRKACDILIPLVSNGDIIDLLAELSDLRMEKKLKEMGIEPKSGDENK